ncbi:MAG: hypothetical protein ACFFDF_20330 [Candidatus Odinarchaeota archaeon]
MDKNRKIPSAKISTTVEALFYFSRIRVNKKILVCEGIENNEFHSLMMGTEEYLTTLTHHGEKKRIPEVLNSQTEEIRKFVAETYIKIENIKEFIDYLEYKEKEIIVPKIHNTLHKWDETVGTLDKKLKVLSKKF